MSLILQDYKGNDVDFKEAVSERFSGAELKEGMLASDMDGTMIQCDLGIMVFLEKLSNPKFWTFSIPTFKRLLLPNGYFDLMKRLAESTDEEVIKAHPEFAQYGLTPAFGKYVLTLYRDIVNLYAAIKKKLPRKAIKYGLQENPLVNEFARKMIAFDGVFYSSDELLSQMFHGQLLMRTRFFAGKNKSDVPDITNDALSRTTKDNVALTCYDINQKIAHQSLGYLDEGVKTLPMDRVVRVVRETRDVIGYLVQNCGVTGSVITTNLEEIARTAVKSDKLGYSEYFERKNIIGSILQDGVGGMKPIMKGKPVIRERKREVADELAAKLNKKLLFALGDSPNADLHMGMKAIDNGGYFIAVGEVFEETRAKFARVLNNMVGAEEAERYLENILFVSYLERQ